MPDLTTPRDQLVRASVWFARHRERLLGEPIEDAADALGEALGVESREEATELLGDAFLVADAVRTEMEEEADDESDAAPGREDLRRIRMAGDEP